jgi:hypothetical protein
MVCGETATREKMIMEDQEEITGMQRAVASVLNDFVARQSAEALASGSHGERPMDEAQPAVDYIKCRWRNWMLADGGNLWCPHQPELFPQMFWSPVAPGIMCPSCMFDFVHSLTREQDHTCDVCGVVKDFGQEWGVSDITLPAFPWSDGSGRVMPPLTIMFGIDLDCYAKIRSGEITCPPSTTA